MYQKTTVPGLLKDASSGQIINTNIDEYHLLKAQRAKAKQDMMVAQKVNRLENEISEIKKLLKELGIISDPTS